MPTENRRRLSYASVAGGAPGSNIGSSARSRALDVLVNQYIPVSSHSHAGSSAMSNTGGRADGTTAPPEQQDGNNDEMESNEQQTQPQQTSNWFTKSIKSHNFWDGGGSGTAPMALFSDKSSVGLETELSPSYLRNTRYMEKLEAARKAKAAAQKETPTYGNGGSNGMSLSTSSSSASLHKMAPSHRGMTYEIVESSPPPEEEPVSLLPSYWKERDKHGCMEISSDGVELRCSGLIKTVDHEAVAARTDNPMPPQCGIYYFEVGIVNKGKDGLVAVGFSGNKVILERLPGWETDSWAYHGDDGKSYCCQSMGKTYGQPFSTGDVVGCGINFRTNTAFFTKNGIEQGTAFKDIKSSNLYPVVGVKRAGTHVKVNFGQKPFMYDIEFRMEVERARIRKHIESQSITSLHPSGDESTFLKELIAQFLRHHGYIDTAAAFAEETKEEQRALDDQPEDETQSSRTPHDIDAINRQQIRAAVLEGDIDKALKLTTVHYPQVLHENPDIDFHLRCRKFVEMMRLSHEPLSRLRTGTSPNINPNNGSNSNVSNVHSDAKSTDPSFEQDMELDDEPETTSELPSHADSDDMDTEDAAVVVGRSSADRMKDTMEYGTVLVQTYKDDRSKDQALKEIFSLFAYQDPKNSPAAHILDVSGRVGVAEELNSAILVSLGKSSAAAVEQIYRQTEVLLDLLNDQGGPGAFVNVGHNIRS